MNTKRPYRPRVPRRQRQEIRQIYLEHYPDASTEDQEWFIKVIVELVVELGYEVAAKVIKESQHG